MSALEAFLKRYPDADNLPPHCGAYYTAGYIDGEMFQFQIIKSLEQQIQEHVLGVLALRAELATLRPAAEALKTAVELGMQVINRFGYAEAVIPNSSGDSGFIEVNNGDPLAATIKAINRAAEAVKENGK